MSLLKNDEPDPIGKVYTRLTVIGHAPRIQGNPNQRLNVRCQCGTEKTVFQRELRRGHTKSCGCLFNDLQQRWGFNQKRFDLQKKLRAEGISY